jgi:short-subunit dehydrogenase
VVAITGASSGIGWECALAFAREGAAVAASARREDRLLALQEAIRGLGGEAMVMTADVAEEQQVRRFVDATLARFGRLDVMVNNAGYGVRGRVEETPVSACRRLMEVNYMGTLYGCQAVVPLMRQRGEGVIINVSSIVGHRSLPGGGPYAATKAAQISLTESLRVELKGTGVAVCSVHPIGTETEFGQVADASSDGRQGGAVGPQQSAFDVARAVVRCAKRPKPEVYPHRLSRGLVWLNALAPSLVDRIAARAARKAGRL